MAKEKAPKKGKKTEAAQDAPAKREAGVIEMGAPARLFEQYRKDVVPAMMKRFSYKSVMQAPRLHKITVNMGIGKATLDPKMLDVAAKELETITGQKASITRSKKAISNFKLRENVPIGCRVTLRRGRMFEFLDRLLNTTLPRVRDFKGVSDKSFDGHGNYTLGIKEQIVFPEIDVDKVTRISGLDVTFVTTAQSDLEAYELLKALGMPFVKRQEVIKEDTANNAN